MAHFPSSAMDQRLRLIIAGLLSVQLPLSASILRTPLLTMHAPVQTAAQTDQRATTSAPPLKTSLSDLKGLVGQIPNTPQLRIQRIRADVAVSRLLGLSAKWPAESPADYRFNLARDAAALRAALQAGDRLRLASTLEAVADDLEVKLEHCTRSGGKLGGSVVVRVRTVAGGAEARNWQVFYLPKVLEAAGGVSPDVFPRLSSPTDETLVPGRYVMWVRQPDSDRVSGRTVVKVGEGKTELLLDLTVPADPR
jgi:hypothetical protein